MDAIKLLAAAESAPLATSATPTPSNIDAMHDLYDALAEDANIR